MIEHVKKLFAKGLAESERRIDAIVAEEKRWRGSFACALGFSVITTPTERFDGRPHMRLRRYIGILVHGVPTPGACM